MQDLKNIFAEENQAFCSDRMFFEAINNRKTLISLNDL
jgi:hypothetical protein